MAQLHPADCNRISAEPQETSLLRASLTRPCPLMQGMWRIRAAAVSLAMLLKDERQFLYQNSRTDTVSHEKEVGICVPYRNRKTALGAATTGSAPYPIRA
jgi:hypothetical protein